MRGDLRLRHLDAERRLRLGLGRADRGLAVRRIARHQVTRRDPQRRAGDEADGGDTIGLHRDCSSWPVLAGAQSVSAWRTRSSTMPITDSAEKFGSIARRNSMPSQSIISTVTIFSKSR